MTSEEQARETNDRLMLDTILDALAQDRPEGLNWPGVARLIRRCLRTREAETWEQAAQVVKMEADKFRRLGSLDRANVLDRVFFNLRQRAAQPQEPTT